MSKAPDTGYRVDERKSIGLQSANGTKSADSKLRVQSCPKYVTCSVSLLSHHSSMYTLVASFHRCGKLGDPAQGRTVKLVTANLNPGLSDSKGHVPSTKPCCLPRNTEE